MKTYIDFYAGGRFQRSTGTALVPVTDPSTLEQVGEVRLCAKEDLEVALHSAQLGHQAWRSSSLLQRQEALRRIAAAVEARRGDFVKAMATEIGCPVWLGQLMQVPMALKDLEFTIAGIDEITWSETIGNGVVERVPVGVVAAITPWNFPVHQIVAKVAGAIAAGCSVVIKPSEIAPGAAQVFMEAVHAADLPAGLVNLVWGGADIGAALVADPRIDQISFTGSTAVGRKIMSAASQRIARVTLELGGKSAALLLDDADLDAALPVVMRLSMVNSGQACVSQSRLLVPRHLLDDVEQRLVALSAQWPQGDPQDEATRLGPVATRSQFDHVCGMIDRAGKEGAQLLCGGSDRPARFDRGCFVSPTVFSSVNPSSELAQNEVFGPVLAVMGFDTDEEAVRLANSTIYGLSGAVWSADKERAAGVARQLRTGQVVINGAPQNLATPFGGWGQSGFGRENGRFGIEECLQYRSLHGLA